MNTSKSTLKKITIVHITQLSDSRPPLGIAFWMLLGKKATKKLSQMIGIFYGLKEIKFTIF